MPLFYTYNEHFEKLENQKISLIFDGFINGLGIVRSLKTQPSIITVVVCKKGAALSYSNKVDVAIIYKSIEELKKIIIGVDKVVALAIPYYCNDNNLKLLIEMKDMLSNISIHPVDLGLLHKDNQVAVCNKAAVIFPVSKIVSKLEDLDDFQLSAKHYIIKPTNSNKNNPFKTKITAEISEVKRHCKTCIDKGIAAMVSEYIPGDDSHLYTLGGYAHQGNLIMPFTGRKIAQRPKNNGVASLAESIENEEIVAIGSRFLKEIKFTGIFQIEFKKSPEGKYYFIEFNPRNWSWGYVATISGSNLPLQKYFTETSSNEVLNTKGVPNYYFWMEGVFYNIILDRWLGVIPNFFKLLFSKRTTFAIFSFKDPMPLFAYFKNSLLFIARIRKDLR